MSIFSQKYYGCNFFSINIPSISLNRCAKVMWTWRRDRSRMGTARDRAVLRGESARPSNLAQKACKRLYPSLIWEENKEGEKRRMRQGRWRILKEFFFLDRLIHCHLTKHYKNWTTISHPAPCTQPNLDFTLIL